MAQRAALAERDRPERERERERPVGAGRSAGQEALTEARCGGRTSSLPLFDRPISSPFALSSPHHSYSLGTSSSDSRNVPRLRSEPSLRSPGLESPLRPPFLLPPRSLAELLDNLVRVLPSSTPTGFSAFSRRWARSSSASRALVVLASEDRHRLHVPAPLTPALQDRQTDPLSRAWR